MRARSTAAPWRGSLLPPCHAIHWGAGGERGPPRGARGKRRENRGQEAPAAPVPSVPQEPHLDAGRRPGVPGPVQGYHKHVWSGRPQARRAHRGLAKKERRPRALWAIGVEAAMAALGRGEDPCELW